MVALTATSGDDASCPTVDKVWIDLASTGIIDCGTPQWGGIAAGTCALATGDSIEATGGSSADFLLPVDIGRDAACDLDGQGTFAMRGVDGTAYEMPVRVATATDEGLVTCR